MNNKCKVINGNEVVACDALGESSEYGNPIGKKRGIWCWRLEKINEVGLSRQFFGAKSGEHVSKGIAFKFCPFCGESISEAFE